MPKVLDKLPEVKRAGRKPKYDYDALFSHGNKAVQLTKGKDFSCSLATMRHNLYRESDRRGISIETVTESDEQFAYKVLSERRNKRNTKSRTSKK